MGDRTCSVDGCEDTVQARGWCNRHYCQWRAYGDPTIYLRSRRNTPSDERFWERVDAEGDCWIWTGRINADGYGQFDDSGTRSAHRWAYEYLVGEVPDGLQLDHLCRVRDCVNPDHLEPVTPAENSRRGVAGALNRVKTACPQGHPYDDANTAIRRGKRNCRECGRRACRDYYYSRRQRLAL
jgi:hypothetical protein